MLKWISQAFGLWQTIAALIAFPTVSFVAFLNASDIPLQYANLSSAAQYAFVMYVIFAAAFYFTRIVGLFALDFYVDHLEKRLNRRRENLFRKHKYKQNFKNLLRHEIRCQHILSRVHQQIRFGLLGRLINLVAAIALFLLAFGGLSLPTLGVFFVAVMFMLIIAATSRLHQSQEQLTDALANLGDSYRSVAGVERESGLKSFFDDRQSSRNSWKLKDRRDLARNIITRPFRGVYKPVLMYELAALLSVVAVGSGIARSHDLSTADPVILVTESDSLCGAIMLHAPEMIFFLHSSTSEVQIIPTTKLHSIRINTKNCIHD